MVMQQTRRHILDILRERNSATVYEIVTELGDRMGEITGVTVRHHLELLRGDGLVAPPTARRDGTPGRPQHVYTLTERAADLFPNNYQGLAAGLLNQLKASLSTEQVDEMLACIATEMVNAALIPDAPLEIRLEHAVAFLNQNGYTSTWCSEQDGGYHLSVSNCPYAQITRHKDHICSMDQKLFQGLLDIASKQENWHWEHHAEGCSCFIRSGAQTVS